MTNYSKNNDEMNEEKYYEELKDFLCSITGRDRDVNISYYSKKNNEKLFEELMGFLYNVTISDISKDIDKLTEIFFMVLYKSYSSETKTYNFKFKPNINYLLNDRYLMIEKNNEMVYVINLKEIIKDKNKSNEIVKWFNKGVKDLLD